MRRGETRTLLRDRESVRVVTPVAVTGSKEPSPTMIEGEGYCEEVWGVKEYENQMSCGRWHLSQSTGRCSAAAVVSWC
jgi:hypothetical protein